jgi:hypothetical protein
MICYGHANVSFVALLTCYFTRVFVTRTFLLIASWRVCCMFSWCSLVYVVPCDSVRYVVPFVSYQLYDLYDRVYRGPVVHSACICVCVSIYWAHGTREWRHTCTITCFGMFACVLCIVLVLWVVSHTYRLKLVWIFMCCTLECILCCACGVHPTKYYVFMYSIDAVCRRVSRRVSK